MKRLFTYLLLISVLGISSCAYDDSSLWEKVNNHENRIAELEELCKQMNSNINAMQTLLNAMEENNYITSVTPVVENGETVGYTIAFTKSEPITIYHGKDGKDGANGANGADGKDGYTPVIGVAKDTDDVYYWTLDGDWLLDKDGNIMQDPKYSQGLWNGFWTSGNPDMSEEQAFIRNKSEKSTWPYCGEIDI